jgi:hypothetical protein
MTCCLPVCFISNPNSHRCSHGPVEKEDQSESSRASKAFSGPGHRLGNESGIEEPIAAGFHTAKSNEPLKVMLTLYKNGFVVNDGPLRSYDDDDGRAFLKDLEQGYVPRELASHGRNIDVVFNPKRDEEYKQAFAAFSGSGMSLGSSSTGTASHAVPVANPESASSDPQSVITLDPTAPTSRVRIKLLNGQAVSGTFNETHTIDDLRKFVAAASGVAAFSLCLSYPPKTLASGSMTLKEAGVLGGSLLQRP